MPGHSHGLRTCERQLRETVGLGQQTFDTGNPGEGARQCDLLQARRRKRIDGFTDLARAVEIAEP